MREQLNENPLVQIGLVGALLVVVAFFVLGVGPGGGGEEEGAAEATAGGATEARVAVAGTGATGTATGATPGEALEGAIEAATSGGAAPAVPAGAALPELPPPPAPVLRAWRANQTIVLVVVRDGGIDDRQVKRAVAPLRGLPDVATFIVPAARIARYAAITERVGVNRVPALVVVSPRRRGEPAPAASVSYGLQTPQSVAQAVIDARYRGPTREYHP